jgi:hypothetical protein
MAGQAVRGKREKWYELTYPGHCISFCSGLGPGKSCASLARPADILLSLFLSIELCGELAGKPPLGAVVA